MYKYYNANVLGNFENDCVVRSISVATGRSWDDVYERLSDIAQYQGTMMDDRKFVRRYLSTKYKKAIKLGNTVGETAALYPDDVILITMRGHITCSRYGTIFDSFDCRDKEVEDAWIVK